MSTHCALKMITAVKLCLFNTHTHTRNNGPHVLPADATNGAFVLADTTHTERHTGENKQPHLSNIHIKLPRARVDRMVSDPPTYV